MARKGLKLKVTDQGQGSRLTLQMTLQMDGRAFIIISAGPISLPFGDLYSRDGPKDCLLASQLRVAVTVRSAERNFCRLRK